MADHPFEGRKLFNVEQANATLPLVRAIVNDLAALSRELVERQQRVAALMAGYGDKKGTDKKGDVYSEELAHAERELERDAGKLQEFVDELRQLGVEAKNGPEGIVDFPAVMDGRPVYLCWKLGEPEVLHWHDLEGGFAGRQPLVASSGTGSTFGDNTLGC